LLGGLASSIQIEIGL